MPSCPLSCGYPQEHLHCPVCSLAVVGHAMCQHHPVGVEPSWATANKIWCDFFHRQVPITRLSESDRDDDPFTLNSGGSDA